MGGARMRATSINWVHGFDAIPGLRMAPDGGYEGVTWSGHAPSGGRTTYAGADLPSPTECLALNAVADRSEREGSAATLLAWGLDIESSRALLASLEDPVAHLVRVFDHPHERLRVDEEFDRVDRARRPSSRAVPVLTTRSRDWANRSLTGVEPSRVLNRRIEANLAIYENRLAVAVLFRLVARLDDFLEGAARLDTASREERQAEREPETTTLWILNQETYQRWADALSQANTEEFQQIHQKLREIRSMLMVVTATRLARELTHEELDLPFVLTNLLREHEDYRYVADLWLDNSLVGREAQAPDAQREQFARSAMEYETYCGGLILQAIRALTGVYLSERVPRRGETASATLANSAAEGTPGELDLDITAELSHSAEGEYTLTVGDSRLRIVPMVASLTSSSARQQVLGATPGDTTPTILIYLDPDYPANRAGYGTTVQRSVGDWSRERFRPATAMEVGLVPAAPSSIRSAERLGQALYLFLATSLIALGSRPLRVPEFLVPDIMPIAEPDVVPGQFRLVRPVGMASANDIGSRLLSRAAETKGSPSARRAARQDAIDLARELRRRILAFDALTICPVCRERMEVQPAHQSESLSTCAKCETRIVLRECVQCGERYAGALISAAYPQVREDWEWATRWAGSAVAARPCWARRGVFVCPSCTQCASPAPDCQLCSGGS